MLADIFRFYLQGLGLSAVTVIAVGGFWFLYRMARGLDKTSQQRRRTLYELFLMVLMTIPVIAFAFMAVLLMMRA